MGNLKIGDVVKYAARIQNVWSLGKDIQTEVENRVMYSYEINTDDELYHNISTWLLENTELGTKQFKASQRFENNSSSLRLSTKPVNRSWFKLGGAKVYAQFIEKEPSIKSWGDRVEMSTLSLGTYSKKGSQQIEKLLAELASKSSEFRSVWITDGYGWEKTLATIEREFDYLVLSGETEEVIKQDLATFLNSEEKYSKLGLPYKRNYLLYGKPGVGKSSFIQAMAKYLNVDIYTLNLDTFEKEGTLQRTIGSIPSGSILLLEDVDAISTSLSRKGSKNKEISLSSVLNILDGAISAKGIITILTSNRPESLDKALLRSGRLDLKVHLDYLNKQKTEELVEKLTGVKVELNSHPSQKFCPADIAEIVKRNLHDENKAIKEIKKYAKRSEELDSVEST